jgi:hypothetical protein
MAWVDGFAKNRCFGNVVLSDLPPLQKVCFNTEIGDETGAKVVLYSAADEVRVAAIQACKRAGSFWSRFNVFTELFGDN